MHAADVDGDGRDEVIIGSAVVDDNGNGLWTTGFGHPDFCYVGDIDPAHPGLEIFYGIEPSRQDSGLCLVDAKTGRVLWALQEPTNHVGTDGMCADIDARYPGSECHAADLDRDRKFRKSWIFSAGGELIASQRDGSMSRSCLLGCRSAAPRTDPRQQDRRLRRRCTPHTAHRPGGGDRRRGGDWREEIITKRCRAVSAFHDDDPRPRPPRVADARPDLPDRRPWPS